MPHHRRDRRTTQAPSPYIAPRGDRRDNSGAASLGSNPSNLHLTSNSNTTPNQRSNPCSYVGTFPSVDPGGAPRSMQSDTATNDVYLYGGAGDRIYTSNSGSQTTPTGAGPTLLRARRFAPHIESAGGYLPKTSSPTSILPPSMQQSPVMSRGASFGADLNNLRRRGSSNNLSVAQYMGSATTTEPLQAAAVTVIRPRHSFDNVSFADGAVTPVGVDPGANTDLSQVRVGGYYQQENVGALIPSDLPRSTLLYVLTASDGRDLIFKFAQYSLQLLICFLKTPSLFSPEISPFTDSWAERFWKNYNTIRHARSLFKIGRGLLNLFTLHAVCERLWMKHGDGVRHHLQPLHRLLVAPLCRLGQALGLPVDSFLDGEEGGPRYQLNTRVVRHRRDVDSLLKEEMYTHLAAAEGGMQDGSSAVHSRTSTMTTPTGATRPFFVNTNAANSSTNNQLWSPSSQGNRSFGGVPGSNLVSSMDAPPGAAAPASIPPVRDPPLASPPGSLGAPVTRDDTVAALAYTGGPEELAANRRLSGSGICPISIADVSPSVLLATLPSVASSAVPPAALVRSERVASGTPTKAEEKSMAGGKVTLLHPLRSAGRVVEDSDDDDYGLPADTPLKPQFGSASLTGGGTTLAPTTRDPTSEDESGGSSQHEEGEKSQQQQRQQQQGGSLDGTAGDGSSATKRASKVSSPKGFPRIYSTFSAGFDDPDEDPPLEMVDNEQVEAEARRREVAAMAAESKDAQTGGKLVHSKTKAYGEGGHYHAATEDVMNRTLVGGSFPSSGPPPIQEVEDLSLNSTSSSSSSSTPVKTDDVQSKTGPSVMGASGTSAGAMVAAAASASNNNYNSQRQRFAAGGSGLSPLLPQDDTELQPAEMAAPSRWRVPALRFSTPLMLLLGARSLAAACRRFLRDLTLLSSERFFHLDFVERHRPLIHRRINYLWLLVSVVDLFLNTTRLMKEGWVHYAMARQNVLCHCACRGNENPNDTTWSMHGYLARRKTDLYFPALDLDYGAPYVSYVNYFEAADPIHMLPACSRCGYLYRESHLYANTNLAELEKPRWLQMYDAEKRKKELEAHQQQENTLSHASVDLVLDPGSQPGRSSGPALVSSAQVQGAAAVGASANLTVLPDGEDEHDSSSVGFLLVPWLMRKVFNYVWLLRVHPNLTSTLLLQARYLAELFLAYKYCFSGYECNCRDAPLSTVARPAGAIAGLVNAAVGLLRVVQSAPP